jgi:phage protein D
MATLNNPTPTSLYRRPRMQVLIGGKIVPGLKSASLTSTNNFQCDTFELTFSLYADPNFGAPFFDQTSLTVDCQISVVGYQQPDNFQSILIGNVDHVKIAKYKGEVILEGRDFTSLFIDSKTNDTFQNQTSSQVVATLAAQFPQLSTDIDPTTTKVGVYYNHNDVYNATGEFTKATKDWDLITYLANCENFDVWVKDYTIHFKQRVAVDSTPWAIVSPAPDVMQYYAKHHGTNVFDIELERALTLAHDVRVEVRAWDTNNGKLRLATSGPPASTPNGANSNVQVYQLTAPPTRDQNSLQQLADSTRQEISRNERTITWYEPSAGANFTPRNMVTLTGTGTSFDNQNYYVQSITRTYDINNGLQMQCAAKNHSVQSENAVSTVE